MTPPDRLGFRTEMKIASFGLRLFAALALTGCTVCAAYVLWQHGDNRGCTRVYIAHSFAIGDMCR
jgi:hypothetical protein